jgi:hypothetical protein
MKAGMLEEMADVLRVAGHESVEAKDLVAAREEPLAKVGTQEPGSSRD